MTLKKKLIFAVITVIGLPLALVACAEIAGRIYVHFRYSKPGKSYGIYMADDELGATHRPNSYNSNSVINNWGFRNTEDITEEKPSGVMRIYCSGGSTTFCYNLDTEESWPSELQRRLRRMPGHERDEVLNAGQITFAVSQEFCLAKRLIPRLKPDVAILFTGINELLAAQILAHQDGEDLDQLLAERRWGVCPRHLDQARFLKRNSVVVRFWDYKLKKLFEDRTTSAFRDESAPSQTIHPWVLANFDQTLRDYLAFLRSHRCKAIIVRYGDNGEENWHLRECVRRFRDRAVAIGREEGAAVCDLVPRVEGHRRRRDLYIASGVHVTKEGAELLAEELCKVCESERVKE